jgi:hypothetical protein
VENFCIIDCIRYAMYCNSTEVQVEPSEADPRQVSSLLAPMCYFPSY